MSLQNVMAIHPVVVEMLQFGPAQYVTACSSKVRLQSVSKHLEGEQHGARCCRTGDIKIMHLARAVQCSPKVFYCLRGKL